MDKNSADLVNECVSLNPDWKWRFNSKESGRDRNPINPLSLPKWAVTWVIIISFTVVNFLLFPKINWIWTDSVPYTLMWHQPGEIKRDDYVVYDFINYLDGMTPVKVTKQVKCLPGDVLMTTESAFYCNGIYLGAAKPLSKSGIPLDQFRFSGRVPEGKVFLMTDHKDGFDSRYWGWVSLDQLERVIPII